MKPILFLALLAVMFSLSFHGACAQSASASHSNCFAWKGKRWKWINAKDGKTVPGRDLVPEGSQTNGDPNHAEVPSGPTVTGSTFVRGSDNTWINSATGEPVPGNDLVPEGSQTNGDPNHAEVPSGPTVTGSTFVRVPCDEEEQTSMTTGGSSAIGSTLLAESTGFYVGVNGNANFALSSSQTLVFNRSGKGDADVGTSHSATGGGGTVSVGYNFGSIEDAQTNPLEGNSLPPSPSFSQRLDIAVEGSCSYSDTSITTPHGVNLVHFDQNLTTLGADARVGIRTGTPFTPFVMGGFGLGISEGSYRIDTPGGTLNWGSATALAPVAQLGAGVDVKITKFCSLSLSGQAAIPMDDYNYRLNNVSSLGGADVSVKQTTPIDLGLNLGFKIKF